MNRFSYRLSSLASIGASRLTGFFYLLFSCFILSSIGFSQSVTDIEGNSYEVVQIGNQLWMAENLKVTQFNNGENIPSISANGTSSGANPYDNDLSNSDTYGMLYNWYAVNDNNGICPEGWHVPTDEEFMELEMELGMYESEASQEDWRGDLSGVDLNVGGQLKSTTDHWFQNNNGATNESGFTALPGGMRPYNNIGQDLMMGNSAFIWTSGEVDWQYGWYRQIYYGYTTIKRDFVQKNTGKSVRCLADDGVGWFNEGCTDPIATNYDTEATFDYGCEYNSNYSLEFDGVDDYVIIEDDPILRVQNNNFTISAWVKNIAVNDNDVFIQKRTSDGLYTYQLGLNHSLNKYSLWIDDDISAQSVFSETDVILNQWVHVAAIRNGDIYSIYINGSHENSETLSQSNVVNDGNIYIGTLESNISWPDHPNDPLWFDGNLDNIQIWNRALSNEELLQSIYEEGYGNDDESLVGHWDFNDVLNGDLLDVTGNGNHGTINGAQWSNDAVVIGCMDEEATNYNPDADFDSGCSSHEGPNWHVSTSGDDINGDGSLEYPFLSIQRGLDAASSDNTIYVGAGTYTENLILPQVNNITLQGDHMVNTTIDGGNIGPVITISGNTTQNMTISGFTIENGNYDTDMDISANLGGGINALHGTNLTLSGLHITGNTGYSGGGIYCDNSSTINLSNSLVDYNTAHQQGGGLYIGNEVILNSVDILYNYAGSAGGMYFYYSRGEISNSKISYNEGQYNSPGLYVHGSNWGASGDWESPGLILNHVEISDNLGDYQVTIVSSVGGSSMNRVELNNVTIAADPETPWLVSGIQIEGTFANTVDIHNSIIGTFPSGGIHTDGDEDLSINYSDIVGGESSVTINTENLSYENNIDADPQFVGVVTGVDGEYYYLLRASSPCINSGNPESTDEDGTISDMGSSPYTNGGYSGPDWYVSETSGSDLPTHFFPHGTGSSEDPFASIVSALNFIGENSVIHVESGTYTENLILPQVNNITLQGAGADSTTIDGGNIGPVITISGNTTQNMTISGFTIENGNYDTDMDVPADLGGGINVLNSNLTLSDLHITDNTGYIGGGVYVDASSTINLSNSLIDYNIAAASGGGLSIAGVAILDSIDVSYNEGGNSGAIHFYYAQGEMSNSRISHNQGVYNSPGLYVHGVLSDEEGEPGLILNHVEISNNIGDHQVNIISGTSHSTTNIVDLNNVTIVADPEIPGLVSGIYISGLVSNMVGIHNSIIGTFPSGGILTDDNENVTIDYSNIIGGESSIPTDPGNLIYENNIDVDPLFVDSSNGDYDLSDGSMCIDAGNGDFNFDGEIDVWEAEQFNGYAPDMGAYESEFSAIVGCMEPLAVNYNPDAWVDDGACSYEGGNYALEFDGVDDYVQFNTEIDNDLGNGVTFSAFIKIQEYGESGYEIFSNYESNGSYEGWTGANGFGFGVSPTGELGIGYNTSGTTSMVELSEENMILTNQIYHVAGTWNGNFNESCFDLYINGTLINSNYTSTGSTGGFTYYEESERPMEIGRVLNSGGYLAYYKGIIDNAKIWSRALIQEEINQSIYEQDFGVDDESLVGHWDFNDILNGDLLDVTENENHGAINGAQWSNDVAIIGCMDEEATNYNPDANFDSGCSSHEGPNWHVSTSGDDINGDGSIEHPFASIQRGIVLSSDGDTILVSVGTYVENIDFIGKSIVVQGENKETTIIDGNQNGSVVKFTSNETSDAVLKNFTIQNGNGSFSLSGGETTYGGGIYIYLSNPVLENLIIQNNSASWGGGLDAASSGSVLRNLTIRNNHGSYAGGGLSVSGAQEGMTIDHTIIYGNTTINYGGGVFIYNMQDATPQFSNVTISNNTSDFEGGGIYSYYHGHSSFLNSIISNNSPEEIYFPSNHEVSSMSVSYSNIEGGQESIITNDNATINWGDGNIDVDSPFIDEENDDYHLLASSPCINAGHPDSTDADGTRADMGAYSYLTDNNSSDWYVSISGSDVSGSGTSGNPFASVQAGLNFAINDSNSVYVAAGTYYENVEWVIENQGMQLIGEDQATTIIDGGGAGSALSINGILPGYIYDDTHLSGFTLTNGYAEYGGGLKFYRSSANVSNMIITGNTAYYAGGAGGGMHIQGAPNGDHHPTFDNIIVSYNVAVGNQYCGAGGIYTDYNIFPTFSNCIIENNYAANKAGGIWANSYNSVTYNNCVIRNNEAAQHGAIYSHLIHTGSIEMNDCEITGNISTSPIENNYDIYMSTNVYLKNVLIADNSGPTYLRVTGPNSSLENVTITNNGGGLHVGGGDDPVFNPGISINNTIVAHNGPNPSEHNSQFIAAPANTLEVDIFVENSLINGLFWIADSPGSENLLFTLGSYQNEPLTRFEDPLFTNPDEGDYTLAWGSPCINTGDIDLDGDGTDCITDSDDQSSDGTCQDMGAYQTNLFEIAERTGGARINEIMINPSVLNYEFFELHNSSDDAVWLHEWSFNINDIASHTIDDVNLILGAGDYKVISRSEHTCADCGGSDYTYTAMPPFNNSQGSLSIYNVNDGQEDIFAYDQTIAENASLEIFTPGISENDAFWIPSIALNGYDASGDPVYGTPQTVNSTVWNQPTANAGGPYFDTDTGDDGAEMIQLNGSASSDSVGVIVDYLWSYDGGDIISQTNQSSVSASFDVGLHNVVLKVTDDSGLYHTDTISVRVYPGVPVIAINELMIETSTNGVLNDEGEYIELINLDDEDVDISGWTLSFLNLETDHIISPNEPLIVPAQGFIVLGRSADWYWSYGASPDYVYGDIQLDNFNETITLTTPINQFADEVSYESWWNAVTNSIGSSMERVSALQSGSDSENWENSTSDSFNFYGLTGTPGEENSTEIPTGDPFVNEHSLSFDGEDDYIQVPDNNNLDGYSEGTWSAWFLLDSMPPESEYSTPYAIIEKWLDSPTHENRNLFLGVQSDGTMRLSIGNSDGDYCVAVSQTNVENMLDSWINVTGTFKSDGDCKLYINSILESTSPSTGLMGSNNLPLKIGVNSLFGQGQPSVYFDGNIDEVQIWNRALTENEIQEKIYQQLIPNYEEGLVAYYQFDEGTGLTAYDIAGGHSGEINGAEYSDELPPDSAEIWGCTDELADNYDSNANMDDGSCIYVPDPPQNLVADGEDHRIELSWEGNECDETSSRNSSSISEEIISLDTRNQGMDRIEKIEQTQRTQREQNQSLTTRSRDCESYDIYYKPEGSGSFELLVSNVQQTGYIHDELDYFDGYCYQLVAVHDGLTSSGSNIVCARTSDCAGNQAEYEDDISEFSDFDDCGDCDGGNAGMDCNGECYGSASYDNCGVCDEDPSNNNYTCTACIDAEALNNGENCDGVVIDSPTINDAGCCEYPAQTYYVDINAENGGNGSEENPFSSIQAAIDASSTTIADMIFVHAGTYPGGITVDHNVQIISIDGQDATIITGQGQSRAFTISDGIDNTTIIDGFTFINGDGGEKGGALLVENAGPTLRNLDIRGNQAQKGGGVYLENSNAIFELVSVTGNYTSSFSGEGGAFYIEHWTADDEDIATVNLDYTTISGNYAPDGGGIFVSGIQNKLIVSNSIIWNNDNEEIKFHTNLDGYSDYEISYSLIDGGQDGIADNGWVFYEYDDSNLSSYDSDDDVDIFINPFNPPSGGPITEGNYLLHPSSPCIATAENESDMGAYPFEPIEGCTDPYACNYDELASILCDDCCEYICFNTFYVDGNVESSEDPQGSPFDPFTSIQDGVNHANPGDTIYVAPAIYYESIVITESVKLYSYYNSPEHNESYIEQTEIDCAPGEDEQRVSCITVASYDFQDEEVGLPEIIGFTIKNGTGTLLTYEDSGESYYVGGGIFIDHSFPIVQHNRFINNGSYASDIIDAGGAIYGFYGGGITYDNIPEIPLSDFSFISPMVLSYNMFEDNFAHFGKTITVIGYEGEIDMSNCEFDVFDSETNGRNGNVSSYWCAKSRDGAWWNYSNGTGRESAIINDVWINPEGSDEGDGDENSPLESISYALSHVFPGADGESRTINLVNYRNVRLRDRDYPLQMLDHINIKGEGIGQTDITGNNEKPVLSFEHTIDSEIRDMTIKDGGGRVGGGIKIYESSPTLKFIEISENQSNEKGGGLYVENSTPLLESVEIRENNSLIGGGIYFKSSDVIIRDTDIKDNYLTASDVNLREGGGLYLLNTNVVVENMVISGNRATGGKGGGIMVKTTGDNGRLLSNNGYNNLSLNNNEADEGAGMYFSANSMNTLNNVLISENVAYEQGGGIFTEEGSYSLIINSSIVGNNAWNDGAGLYVEDVTEGPVIVNSIIWGNTLTDDELTGVEQISFDLDSDVHLYIAYSNIEGAYNSDSGEWFTLDEGFEEDQINFLESEFSGTNLDIDPLFVNPSGGDFSLSSTSPCINTGTGSLSFTNSDVLSAYLAISDEFDPIISIDDFEGCSPDMGYIEFVGESDASDCVCDGESCLGCTDELANNYNEDAIMDDGSCLYDSQAPSEFGYQQSELQAFYYIWDANIEGEPLEVGVDYIAAFNGDVCVGNYVWEGPAAPGNLTTVPAMGDDGSEFTDGYLLGGDVPTFRIYDASEDIIYYGLPEAESDLEFSNNSFHDIMMLDGVLDQTVSYSIDLHQGANLVSFHALPENTSLANVLASIEGSVNGIVGEGVAASPNPILGWVGSLSAITGLSGYWVKMDEAGVLEIEGAIPSNPSQIYNIHSGSNLISWPSTQSVSIPDALPDDVENYFTGFVGEGIAASPNPVLGWVGSMSAFEVNRGYWAKTNNTFSFSFDISGSSVRESDYESDSPYQYTQSMNQAFYFINEIDDLGLGLEIGDWLLVYQGNVLVGARQWSGPYVTDLPAMGYDESEGTIGYCLIGDAPEFKWVRSDGQVIDLDGEIPGWLNNEIYNISLSVDNAQFPTSLELYQNYPNPFNGSTIIPFDVHQNMDISISIYDVTGKLISKLFTGNLDPGAYSFTWDSFDMHGNSAPSGFYIYQITGNGITIENKMILMK